VICDECRAAISAPNQVLTCGTGYAQTRDGKTICYACCGKRDRQTMIDTGHSRNLPLYLVTKPDSAGTPIWEVTNWPGSLRFRVSGMRKGKHNIARTRYDIWFNGPDGFEWHGVQIGEWTQIVNCRRTKTKFKTAAAEVHA